MLTYMGKGVYIFGNDNMSTLRVYANYIVCYGCKVVIYFMATTISINFPLFPSTLAPFSQILNHIMGTVDLEGMYPGIMIPPDGVCY